MILGRLRDKNFKFRCIYVPTRLDIMSVTQYLSYHVSFLIIVHIHFVSFFTLLLVLVIVYLSSHSSDMLLISYHLSYSCHLHILVIFFICFMPTYTLEVDTGNYKGPKVLLSLCKTMTFIRVRRHCYHCTRQ